MLIGHEEEKKLFLNFLHGKKKICFLIGEQGIGKTYFVHTILHELHYNKIENLTKDSLLSLLKHQPLLFEKRNIILLEYEKEYVSALRKYPPKYPVVFFTTKSFKKKPLPKFSVYLTMHKKSIQNIKDIILQDFQQTISTSFIKMYHQNLSKIYSHFLFFQKEVKQPITMTNQEDILDRVFTNINVQDVSYMVSPHLPYKIHALQLPECSEIYKLFYDYSIFSNYSLLNQGMIPEDLPDILIIWGIHIFTKKRPKRTRPSFLNLFHNAIIKKNHKHRQYLKSIKK